MKCQFYKLKFLQCGILIFSLLLVVSGQDNGIQLPETYAPWCVVTGVVPDSFAESLGLQQNDIILSINGVPIHTAKELGVQRESAANSDIEVLVWRNGSEILMKKYFPGGVFGVYTEYVSRGVTLTVEEMNEDLDSLFAFIYEVHPDPYASFPESEFRSEKEHLYASIQEEISGVEFWKMIARFTALIQDGHTRLILPDGDWHYRKFSGDSINIPLSVLIAREGVYVEQNLSTAPLSPGDKILTINDRDIDTILDYLVQYVSGELRHFRLSQIERNFHQMLYQLAGIEPPFSIKVRSVDGTTSTHILDGVDWYFIEETIDTTPGLATDFIEVPELKTAILRFNVFAEHLPDFFRSAFRTVNQKDYRFVIIDLQDNGGGNSLYADTLMSYITDKPYRFFGGGYFKLSRHMLPQFEIFPELQVYESYELGSIIDLPEIKPSRPIERETRFSGDVFCLISNRTYSTAVGFAAILRDFEIGTLVGEETGGIPTTFGDSAYYTLPQSSIGVVSSMKFLIRPSGDPTYVMRGLEPDTEVPVTGLDVLEGRDPVLEKVKRIIDAKLQE